MATVGVAARIGQGLSTFEILDRIAVCAVNDSGATIIESPRVETILGGGRDYQGILDECPAKLGLIIPARTGII